jgi:Uma2 family endonuclease
MASRTVAKPEVERRWTLEEWLKLPEGPPFYELEDGRLIEMPSPRVEHQEDCRGVVFHFAEAICPRTRFRHGSHGC